jgi:hypothetical protein
VIMLVAIPRLVPAPQEPWNPHDPAGIINPRFRASSMSASVECFFVRYFLGLE